MKTNITVLVIDKKIILVSLPFALLTFVHLPVSVFPHIFDKNQAPQFIVLTAVATLFGGYIAINRSKFRVDKKIYLAILFLLFSLTMSTLLSGNLISALTGDTGRYAGAVSLISLVVISLFHSKLNFEQLKLLIPIFLTFIVLQAIVGIAQHWNLVELPGVDGVTGTFGNQDFFTAFLGVSAPLFFLAAIGRTRKIKSLLVFAYLLCIYAIYLSGPLQGWVDLAITALGIVIYLLRKHVPRRNYQLNSRTFVGTLAVVIWAEFIFLVPFLGSWIPVLGNDIQVKIRANFWVAGTNSFFSQPLFGLGPDQYGNYYEKFRTVSDTQNYSRILSNDAHSASVQTLSTLGFFGTLSLLILIAFLIRSFLLLWDQNPQLRSRLFALGLFFFVYLTNSFVSPMTLPAKYLLWALGGFVVGQIYRSRVELPIDSARSTSLPVIAILLVIILVSSNFSLAKYRYSVSFEKYAKNQQAIIDYAFSPFLPCFMYFEGQFKMVESQGNQAIANLALAQVATNPRCVSARVVLAQIYELSGDKERLKNEIYQLVDIAPSREEVLNIGMRYANRNQDEFLLKILQRELSSRGLIYMPGTEG